MTRINTNVSALSAQKSLQRSQASLQSALTRLSTGLRINTGKDDPAGLIASEVLRADITSVETAISNSERANQVIATADSALGQVSALLNDIRGLVTEAANEGALSTEQIAANQLQIDSSLEAINRIAQTTTFQGRKLLDGSFDFITTATQNFDDIVDLEINQANLGATGQIDVEIEISAAATKAQITNDGNPNAAANATISFASSLQIDDGGTTDLDVWTTDSNYAGFKIQVATAVLGAGKASATYNAGGNKITLTVDKNSAATVANVEAAIANLTDGGAKPFAASASGTWANTAVANTTAGTDQLTVTAASGYEGPDLNNVTIQFDMNGNAGANPLASYSPTTNTLTISIASDETGPVSLAAIESTIDTNVAQFDASVSTNGSGNIYVAGDNGVDLSATGDTGPTGGGVLLDSLAFTLGGKLGVEVFSFDKYTKISKIVEAVNLVSDATGVTATDNDGTLELDSAAYGSDAFVSVNVISEGEDGEFETNLSATRDTGTDISASVNGYTASGQGNTLSINTATLDLSATITAASTDTIQFSITEGGAMFQLGPDVVSNQQARLGMQSVNTAQLRGETGRLYTIGSGESADLATDPTTAAQIVDEVISKIASLRGRLGAFQKATLEPNIASLNDTVENLTAAESSIRDADFAAETAALTRAQILVQSGVSVVAIANSNPQNVLALLR